MKRVYVALGSNLGVSREHISTAIEKIESLEGVASLTMSPWYRTAPIGGPQNQPDYTNAVSEIFTRLSPSQLLSELQAIEQEAGRVRDIRWGPRTLDLDIIWYEGESSDDPFLTLPHPRAHDRAFVLQPLIDLEASFTLQGKSLDYWRNLASDQGIAPLT